MGGHPREERTWDEANQGASGPSPCPPSTAGGASPSSPSCSGWRSPPASPERAWPRWRWLCSSPAAPCACWPKTGATGGGCPAPRPPSGCSPPPRWWPPAVDTGRPRGDPRFWWAAAAALPVAAAQVGADLTRRNRAFLAEAAGAVAMGLPPRRSLWRRGGRRARHSLCGGDRRRALPSSSRASPDPPQQGTGCAPRRDPRRPRVLRRPPGRPGRGRCRALDRSRRHRRPLGLGRSRPGAAPGPARTLGWTQVAAGLLVVGATAAGYHLGW